KSEMSSLHIDETSIPNLTGKVALITGGASGIGFAAASILNAHGATVHILDRNPPSSTSSVPSIRGALPHDMRFHECDVTDWQRLRGVFAIVGHVDYVFANAGVSETEEFLADNFEEDGGSETQDGRIHHLREPGYAIINTNLRAVLNAIKLAHYAMKRDGTGGSIVITASATAYSPEQSLPVYSALKLAIVGLVRSLRHNLSQDNITINAVAPAVTETALVSPQFLGPIKAAGLPTSTARHVGLALVYSAVAREARKVEVYGKEPSSHITREGPWNGRVIFTLGDSYTELEEPLADLRPQWMGEENTRLTRMQQFATDSRSIDFTKYD
ncbi:NAD(P)-binding protein, partial [Lophium mytilinum]